MENNQKPWTVILSDDKWERMNKLKKKKETWNDVVGFLLDHYEKTKSQSLHKDHTQSDTHRLPINPSEL